MYLFSGLDKLIYLQSGTTSFDVENLYSSWKNWISSGDNSKYLPTFETIGGDSISSTKTVSPYYFLANGWRIKPFESSHQLTVNGNLFVRGGEENPFVVTTGNYNVFINMFTSSDSTITEVATNSVNSNTLNRVENKLDNLTALSLA